MEDASSGLERRKYSPVRKVNVPWYLSGVLEVPLYLPDGKLEDWPAAGARNQISKPKIKAFFATRFSFTKGGLSWFCMQRGIASPPTVGRESEAEQQNSVAETSDSLQSVSPATLSTYAEDNPST